MAILMEYLLLISGLFMMICGINGEIKVSMQGATLSTNEMIYEDSSINRTVDGRKGGWNCGCCTAIARPCWLLLDLPQTYLVKRIVLYGRTDGAFFQFKNITLSGGQNATRVNDTVRTYVLSPPQAMQVIRVIADYMIDQKKTDNYVTICEIEVYRQAGYTEKKKDNYMTICEIEVYRQEDCVNGTYGPDCNKTCNCLQGPCDAITGTCGAGCQSGWRGTSCNEACEEGSYGINCSLTCSALCRNNRRCHRINGACFDGCEDGYDFFTDKTCYTSCALGLYGQNCSLKCSVFCRNNQSCHNVNGMCLTGCEDGYDFIADNKCNTRCADGLYGRDCSFDCSAFCRNSRLCHHTNGTCANGCEDGYDFFTDKTCKTTCGQRSNGRDCSLFCSAYCHNNQSCHYINGTCPDGCEDGYDFYRDKSCNTTCMDKKFGKTCLMDCNCGKCHHINGSCAMFEQQCDTGFEMEKEICKHKSEEALSGDDSKSDVPVAVIAGVAAGGVALIVVIVVILLVLKMRRPQDSELSGNVYENSAFDGIAAHDTGIGPTGRLQSSTSDYSYLDGNPDMTHTYSSLATNAAGITPDTSSTYTNLDSNGKQIG